MSINDDILWKIDTEIGKDKKVVELRREIEDLTNSNNFWKRKCSEMRIALKTYEKGRYQEHLENELLHSIINEIRELADKYEMGKYDYNVPCFELKEILDKENKQ